MHRKLKIQKFADCGLIAVGKSSFAILLRLTMHGFDAKIVVIDAYFELVRDAFITRDILLESLKVCQLLLKGDPTRGRNNNCQLKKRRENESRYVYEVLFK